MPADLLLPAFAVTLALNALFVAFAIRALRQGGTSRSVEPPAPGPLPHPGTRPEPVDGERRPAPATAVEDVPPEPERTVAEATAPSTQPDAPTRPDAEPLVSVPVATARAGRRRKFSLPPPEDHDKVSRSIETFLDVAGVAPSSPPATDPQPESAATAAASAPVAVVTVAALQLVGNGPRDVLERTVRSTARAVDDVSIDRRGRVRVVLHGTGEVAAHAYLRRIRSMVEPLMEAADPPSRIAFATATELDGDILAARRRADRRLVLALGAAQAPEIPDTEDAADDAARTPRAAGDGP